CGATTRAGRSTSFNVSGTQTMLRKIVLGSLLGGGVTVALAGTSAYSYFRTGLHSLQQSIRDSIPVEVEIKRARDLISNLKPEIADNLQRIAHEEVDVSRLTKELNRKHDSLAKAEKDILRIKHDLSQATPKLVYAGREYSLEQVRDDLHQRFKQF
ncbi:MAG: hypothetical protein ACK56I_31585, partial [bacterium]